MTGEQRPRPFDLPASPVDRHRVEWWTLRRSGVGNDCQVSHVEAVYHVNSTWVQVCPDDAERHGADFVNHWQIFNDGQFTARTRDGWTGAFDGHLWSNEFASEKEAIEEAIRRLRERQEALLADVSECRGSIERHFVRLREIRDAARPPLGNCPRCNLPWRTWGTDADPVAEVVCDNGHSAPHPWKP